MLQSLAPSPMASVMGVGSTPFLTMRTSKAFCSGDKPPAPSPAPIPPELCEDTLKRLCGDVRKNETACDHCIRENYKKEEAENCTGADLKSFCSGDKCEAILTKECGSSRPVRAECEMCLEKLEHKDDCTLKEEFEFCDGGAVTGAR